MIINTFHHLQTSTKTNFAILLNSALNNVLISQFQWRDRYKTVRTQGAMNATFSRRYGVIAIALSWSLAFVWATPPAVDPFTAAIDGATQACSVNWRDGGRYAYPAAYLLVGLVGPLVVEAAAYYGVYIGVIRASRRLHQRAIVSGRGSIVNLAMRVSQSSSRWSVVSCQSRSSTSTTSSGVLSSVNNLLMVSLPACTNISVLPVPKDRTLLQLPSLFSALIVNNTTIKRRNMAKVTRRATLPNVIYVNKTRISTGTIIVWNIYLQSVDFCDLRLLVVRSKLSATRNDACHSRVVGR